MTIITKPLSEKKEGKLILPLVENDQLANEPIGDDVESQCQDPSFIILRTRARRVSTTTTLCLLITALMVVGVGIIGGTYLYRQYLRSQVFKGWCNIPYDQSETALLVNNVRDYDDATMLRRIGDDFEKNYNNLMQSVFSEKFELDLENEDYEKIDVPDFREGRTGRFIHDFNTNKTGIIDVTGRRCFVMPLNRDNVLPPRNLSDLIHKMWEGYYKVDTEVVRETMRVVTPPVTDMEDIGNYIANECQGFPMYRLEKYIRGVWKRSADLENEAKFAQFSGKGIVELDIVNLDEVQMYEKELLQ